MTTTHRGNGASGVCAGQTNGFPIRKHGQFAGTVSGLRLHTAALLKKLLFVEFRPVSKNMQNYLETFSVLILEILIHAA